MDKLRGEALYAQAKLAYANGQYEQALAILSDLDREFPGQKNLLKAIARTLDKLERFEEALQVCDRLERELNFLNTHPFRDTLATKLTEQRIMADLSLGFDKPDEHEAPPPVVTEPTEQLEMFDLAFDSNDATTGDDLATAMEATATEQDEKEKTARRFRIKPLRLALLILICAGMYFGYVPYWLGGGLIAAYFIIKFTLGKAFIALFSIPFKMKGKALAGATVELHGFEWTEKPTDADADDDGEEKRKNDTPLRYAWLDVTITPQFRSQGFTHWEPGELMIAPLPIKVRTLDDMDKCFRIYEVKFINDGQEQDDEGLKVQGPQRLKVLAEFPEDAKVLKFVYYGNGFGKMMIP